ncbi:C2H2-type domain-containing protein [Caenorhabditis elegans]|uniref:C2H2-type domain-containing protein n=1 Tax=Caenorhabditis elegans TaxID=6239 RepID=C0P272_CAEEL|nr:C2H2-type domain-containing protein [Caenorhabditis elegans]CAX51681.2 C2H2-type domain-containing protein [Caenorhabditis elegans]
MPETGMEIMKIEMNMVITVIDKVQAQWILGTNLYRPNRPLEQQKEARKRCLSGNSGPEPGEINTDSQEMSDMVPYGPEPPPPKKRNDEYVLRSKGNIRSSDEKRLTVGKRSLPFYYGDEDKKKTSLKKIIALEFASILRTDYVKLEKRQRDQLHNICNQWELPDNCRFCKCALKFAPNFLSHVLSIPHITKSMDQYDRRFTFEGDYRMLKNEIEKVKTNCRDAPSPLPPAMDPVAPYHVRDKCTQS